jgi:DNA (cytosine-5)-methyltransferase 1
MKSHSPCSLSATQQPTRQKRRIANNISCVDLFCGAGGLTHGLKKNGINVISGIDLDPQCRFPYESNNGAHFLAKDICDLSGNELQTIYGKSKLRLLAGCAPCQPFSSYSQKGRQNRKDSMWNLVLEFGRLVEETQPDFVTMENVPQLLDHSVFEKFLTSLDGYETCWQVIDCTHFGVPQTRKRLVLLASLHGNIKFASESSVRRQPKTVREAISHLPHLDAGSSDPSDPIHTASRLSSLNLRRIKASRPGGTWRDWDKELLAHCHRKNSGQTYPSVYGRMEWDVPAPTITTQCFGYGNGRFGHPEQDRAISLREAAILQTFPHNYRFVAPGERVCFSTLGRLIGNAVPVRIGEIVAQSFIEHARRVLLLDPKIDS